MWMRIPRDIDEEDEVAEEDEDEAEDPGLDAQSARVSAEGKRPSMTK